MYQGAPVARRRHLDFTICNAILLSGLLRHWSVDRTGGRGLPDNFKTEMCEAREGALWPHQGQNAADGLRKGMKRNVGVTTELMRKCIGNTS
jgi:hypothetical protein